MINEPGIYIGIGMVLSLFLTESLGVTAGGIIVPGYIALHLHNPLAVVITFSISLVVLAIVKLLSMRMLIYGKRRLVLSLLLGFWLGFVIREFGTGFWFYDSYYEWFQNFSQVEDKMIFIGYIIPGLIASWMDRQGATKTISTVLISASVVNLILMLLGKYV